MSKKVTKIIIPIVAVILAISLCIVAVGAVAIGAIALGGLVVGTTVVGGIVGVIAYYLNQPEIVAAHSLSNFTDDLLARNEIKPIYDTLNGGSVDFNVTDIKYSDSDEYNETFDMSVKGKFYFAEDAMMLKNFYLYSDNQSINGELYISDTEMYIKETEILKDAYGIRLSTLAEDLSESIFAANSNSDYALDKDTYETLLNVCKMLKNSDELKDDAEELYDDISKDIWEIVIESAEVTSANADVRLNGELKNKRVISIKIDEEALDAIIWNTYFYLRDSQDIMEFLDDHEDSFEPILEEITDSGYNSISEAYQKIMCEAEDDVKELRHELRASDFDSVELKLTTPKLTSKLLKLEVKYNNELMLSLDCGEKGIKKTDTVTLLIPYTLKVTYRVTEPSKNKVNAEFVIDNFDKNTDDFKIFVNINNNTGKYEAGYVYTYNGESYIDYDYTTGDYTYLDYSCHVAMNISGKINTVKDTTTITVDKFTLSEKTDYEYDYYNDYTSYTDYEYSYSVSLRSQFVIDTKDEMPDPISYKTIDQIRDRDLDNIIERLERVF